VLPVVFGAAAATELAEAHDWYGARNPAVAARFLAEVGIVIERIATAPAEFPIVHRDIRRARCRRFPYSLFFRVAGDAAQVIACFHSSRDPRHWQRRG
jgi:plasmid stabilization system protein ParE